MRRIPGTQTCVAIWYLTQATVVDLTVTMARYVDVASAALRCMSSVRGAVLEMNGGAKHMQISLGSGGDRWPLHKDLPLIKAVTLHTDETLRPGSCADKPCVG